MRRLINQFNRHGLFLKIFIVMVVSVISVSILITYSTIRMSERLFMDTFSITNSKVINQIKTSFESLSYSIVTATNNIQQSGTIKSFLTREDSDSLTMNQEYFNMNQQMTRFHTNVDGYEVSMTVTGVNGRKYSTNHAYWTISDEELEKHPITLDSYNEPKRLKYRYDNRNLKKNIQMEPIIIASKALMERSTGSIYGMMYIAIRENEFKKFYANYTSEGNNVVVIDQSGLIVSSNQKEMIGQTNVDLLNYAKEIEEEGLDYKNVIVIGKKHIVLTEYLSAFDMYLVNLIDKQLVMEKLINTKAIVLISSGIVIVALFIIFLISRGMTKSLRRFVRQISNMAKYDFEHYVSVNGSYETRQLAHAFNFMLDELHEYVEKLLQTQNKQRNAELEALQQQINPHFLYNTLASIKIMVQQGNKEKAAEMINALISLLQNTIGNVSETIAVEEELKNMKNYVFINQARYGERIRVNYFVSPDCMAYQLPKLIIQPFIENAFFHAFSHKEEGYIHILISKGGDGLVCEVVDNGDGMEVNVNQKLPNYKSKRQLFSGIGVRNVHERIGLLYGEQYGVEISSKLGAGTRVKIRLPLLTDKNSHSI